MKNIIAFLLIGLLSFPVVPANAALTESDKAIIAVDNFIANGGAENGSVGMSSYADAAGASPVDMTGGAPNTTCVASPSSPLAGNASWLMTVTTGATRQGEGCAFQAVTIPLGKRGKTLTASFDYSVTGTLVAGDFPVYAYQIDGANPHVITPNGAPNTSLLGASGTALVTFTPDSDATQIRFGIHVGRASNTGAVTIKADSFKIATGQGQAVYGMAGSNWIDYTPTISGCGAATISQAQHMRSGQMDKIRATFTCTTAAASVLKVSLPSGETAVQATDTVLSGSFESSYTGGTQAGVFPLLLAADTSNIQFGLNNNPRSGFTAVNANTVSVNGSLISITADVPIISGWDAGVSMAASSTYFISSYLAAGTRVTGSAPTSLGQYRSYLRNSSANTYTETNGSPTAAPTAADGIKIYAGGAWASADTSNSPTRYDIFVGKNKNITWSYYKSAGRTGLVFNPGFQPNASSFAKGYATTYDPTTGIASIYPLANSNTTGHVSGVDDAGADVSGIYFDVKVSENAQMVGAQAPRSEVQVTGSPAAGFGSTNTKIRRFASAQVNQGTAITYTDDATLGGSFKINEDGVYAITYYDLTAAGTAQLGISKNTTTPTTAIFSVASSEIACALTVTSAFRGLCSNTTNLRAGDVIRAHTDGTQGNSQDGSQTRFTITKVSN